MICSKEYPDISFPALVKSMWHDAVLDPPPAKYMNRTVLIVKRRKDGNETITFGSFNGTVLHPKDMKWEGTWSTNNGKGDVIFWMPLPEIPKEGDNVITHTEWR